MIAEGLRPLARPIDTLSLLPYNPRRGDVAAVARSLQSFGQRKPIVAKVDGTVIAGNHTLQAARSLCWTEIAVVFVDDDEATAKAYALADNRTAELGGYDEELLADLILEVQAVDAELLAATGWQDDDLKQLLTRIAKQIPVLDPDNVPAPPPPRSATGDLWVLGRHRLLCGDSTVRADVERVMNGERAVLMATDPPYLVDYEADNHPQSWGQAKTSSASTKNKGWDAYVDGGVNSSLYSDFLALALDVALDERAPLYQWHAGVKADLVLKAWDDNGVLAHQQIVWVKARAVLSRSDLMYQHEPCYYGWKRGFRPEKSRRAPSGGISTTVWQIDQQGQSDGIHPTQKPVEVIRRPIAWHTRVGELLYEPFAGSGTAIIAAETEGRRCFGVEQSPVFVDVICKRFQIATGVLPIDEVSGEPHDFMKD